MCTLFRMRRRICFFGMDGGGVLGTAIGTVLSITTETGLIIIRCRHSITK